MLPDLMVLDVQDRHRDLLDKVRSSTFMMYCISLHQWAFTMLVDGKVAAVCGCTDGELWAFLGKDLRRGMVQLTRHGLKMMKKHGGPVKAWVDNNEPNAIRWVKLAGFRPAKHGYWVCP